MGRPFTARAVLQAAAVATGNGSELDVSGMASASFQISGTFVATVTFEGTVDGANWIALRARNAATGARATTATAAGVYIADCAGFSLVRARVTWSSGTSVTVTAYAGPESASDGGEAVAILGTDAGASLVASTAYEASHVLKNAAGTLISLIGYNSKTAAQFIQVHNAAALPADAAVPSYVFLVPASSNFSLDIPVTGAPFTTGIVVCNSSTGPIKTIGTTDCWFSAVVK